MQTLATLLEFGDSNSVWSVKEQNPRTRIYLSLDLNAVLDLLKVYHSEVLFACQIANAEHHEIYELKLAYKFILIL